MTAESPARPSLEHAQIKPDVIERLRWWLRELPPEYVGLREDLADAIGAITGLRETCERRLAMIKDLKRDLADARPEEGR